jgi:hypothetical protein
MDIGQEGSIASSYAVIEGGEGREAVEGASI